MHAFPPVSGRRVTGRAGIAFAVALTLLSALPAPGRAQRTSITQEASIGRARPTAVTAVPGGKTVAVALSGTALDALTGAAVVKSGRVVDDVRAELLRGGSASERTIEIAAGERAPAGTYELVVTTVDALRRTKTLATKVSVTVEKAPPPAEPAPTLRAFDVSASRVASGGRVSATITLDGPAPTGGSVVAVTSSDPTVAAPAASAVTVPAGRADAKVDVDVRNVTEDRTVSLRASLGAAELSAALVVEAAEPELPHLTAVRPDGMIFTQTPTSTQGSVDIHIPAPPGGTQIALSTNRSDLVTIPASVTISEGQTTATFTVALAPISTATPGAQVNASCGVCVTGIHLVADDGAGTMTGTFGANGPDGAVVSDLVLPAQVLGGGTFNATVHLHVQPQSPVRLDFQVAGPAALLPQVVVPAFQQDVTVQVHTETVTQPTTLEISARSYDYELTGTTRSIQVLPIVTELASVQMRHGDFWTDSGPDNLVTVRLTAPSPLDRWIHLESSDPRVQVADSALMEAGPSLQRDVPFDLLAQPTESFPVTITARAGTSEMSATATAHPLPRVATVTLEGTSAYTLSGAGEVTGTVSLSGIGPVELPVRLEIRRNGLASDRATVVESPVIPAGATDGTFRISVPEGEPADLEIRAVLHPMYQPSGAFFSSQATATLHVGG